MRYVRMVQAELSCCNLHHIMIQSRRTVVNVSELKFHFCHIYGGHLYSPVFCHTKLRFDTGSFARNKLQYGTYNLAAKNN